MKKVEDRLKLDDILDLCADYEREIEAELRLRDLAIPEQKNVLKEEAKSPNATLKSPNATCISPLQWSPFSTLHPNR